MGKSLGRLKKFLIIALLTVVVSSSVLIVLNAITKYRIRTIITETYFVEHDGLAADRANAFAEKMIKIGRKITIKIYSEESKGVIGVLVITEEKAK